MVPTTARQETKKMSDELVIEQKQGLGNAGTQVGVQNNYGLSPVEATRMAFEIFREYYPQLREEALKELNNLVEEKLSSIPQELIDSPKPRIAVPTLQNASITEEREIRELYANLLANSMNKVVKNGVHPGFVEIIKQLSPDEAKILKYIRAHTTIPTVTLRYENDDGSGIDIIKNFSDIGEKSGCEIPQDIAKYFDNLVRLGLIISADGLSSLTDKAQYDPLKNHRWIKPHATTEKANSRSFTKYNFNESFVEITAYGKSFCSICLETQKVIILKSQKG